MDLFTMLGNTLLNIGTFLFYFAVVIVFIMVIHVFVIGNRKIINISTETYKTVFKSLLAILAVLAILTLLFHVVGSVLANVHL